MAEAATVRSWQFDLLRKGPAILRRIVRPYTLDDLTTWRDGGTGWTVVEVLCHLRDFEYLYTERARITVSQDMGDLPHPDPDAWAVERNYNAQDPEAVLDDWVQQRDVIMTFWAGVDDAAWQRVARHPKRGPLTLQDQLTLMTFHDVNHTEQITRILAEKKSRQG